MMIMNHVEVRLFFVFCFCFCSVFNTSAANSYCSNTLEPFLQTSLFYNLLFGIILHESTPQTVYPDNNGLSTKWHSFTRQYILAWSLMLDANQKETLIFFYTKYNAQKAYQHQVQCPKSGTFTKSPLTHPPSWPPHHSTDHEFMTNSIFCKLSMCLHSVYDIQYLLLVDSEI